MLDRILNINTNEKYKNSKKIPVAHLYTIHRQDHEKHRSRDAALFSPLAKLLSKINWTILNVEYLSNDEVFFHFLVEDLEFKTTIQYSRLYNDTFQEFFVSRIMNNSRKNTRYETKFKVSKDRIRILQNPELIEIEKLKQMFFRISELNIQRGHIITDTRTLESFIIDIERNIKDEMNYILEVIYTFITTRNKSKVKDNFVLKSSQNIPIIMQKVAIICTE